MPIHSEGDAVVNLVRGPRPPYRPAVDVIVLVGVGAVVVVLLNAGQVRAALPPAAYDLVTLCAAGVGAACAVLAVVASRLLGDVRLAWTGAALALYGAVVLPWSTVLAAHPGGPQRAPLLITAITAMVVLVLSVRPPEPLGAWGCWVIVAAGGVTALGVSGLPGSPQVQAFAEGPAATVAVLVGWTTASVVYVIAGYRIGSAPRLRLGLGLVTVAVAQLYRVSVGARVGTDLAFAGLRLVGLCVLLLGLAEAVARALGRLESEHWDQQEALTAAALMLERTAQIAAERNHELRNGLAGLAGITQLLSDAPGRVAGEPLRHAVLAELSRLHALVDAAGDHDVDVPDGRGDGYSVPQVITDRAALRESTGTAGAGSLELRVEAGLRAAGNPDVLAQVLTNLLANCDRHAPGAPISVDARRRDGQVVVEVRDRGPGLPPGEAGSVLQRGVRDEAAGGEGLGLHICAELVAREGGRLVLCTVDDPHGCSATVTLPAVTEVTLSGPVVADQAPPGVSSRMTGNR